MTVFEEPPIVDLDEILDEEEAHEARVTRLQLGLIIVGGIVGVTGLLIALVVAAPPILDLVSWINSIQKTVNP